MNFRQMRYVIALSEELNFSHAAERLYISQPSLSQCIRAVEREVGAQLFERAGGHVLLTPAGEKYVEIAREILAQADHLKEVVARAGKAEPENLLIGVSDSGSIMTPMLLPDLQKRFPGVRFSFVEQPVGELELRVLKGELDLIFTMLPTHQREKFEIIPILRDDFLIACPHTLPAIQPCLAEHAAAQAVHLAGHAAAQAVHLAGNASNQPNQPNPSNPAEQTTKQSSFPALPLPLLMSLPFITVKRKRFELEMSRALADPDAFRPNVIMEVANVITALSMVAAGNGVCPVPATVMKLGAQDPRVVFCRIDQLEPACELAVSHRKGIRLPAAAQAYVDLLKELVRKNNLDQ